MKYNQTRELINLLDELETNTCLREREKNKGGDATDWDQVSYYSTLIREGKESIFNMMANTK
tara:strand:- start:49 stop:234 length:186 start_codon:yes stop_codon:yes gene_type:complete